MRTLCIVTSVVFVSLAVFGQETPQSPNTNEIREKALMESGGPILMPERGPYILLLNAQNKIDANVFDEEVAHAKRVFKYPFHSSATTNQWRQVAKDELTKGASVVVVVAEMECDSSLVVLPSEQIAIVNINGLKDEKESVFNNRFHKELLRGIAYALGVGNTSNPICILKPVKSLEELDALQGNQLGPDALSAAMRVAKARGMSMMRMISYKAAVYQGWAPPPTNDYQKAVWDRVMAEKASATNATSKASAPAK
jgi:predicted Zn-dependent protease